MRNRWLPITSLILVASTLISYGCGSSATAPLIRQTPTPPSPPPCLQSASCTVEPFLATNNFALLETQPPYPIEYFTGAGADWNVLSWGQQPGVNWKPFSVTNPSTTEELDTSSTLATAYDPMSVSFQRNPATGAWASTTLGQTATTYCGSSSNPQEFDLFLQPNDQTIFVRTNPSGILSPSDYPGGIPSLEEITAIDFQGTVTSVAASQSTSSFECPVNQSDFIASLVLDSTTGQTLFYQLNLGLECYPSTGSGCYTSGIRGEYFCGVSNPYCIADPITSYGHSFLNPGDSITMGGINIAPRLKALVSGGSPDGKMDRHPADWRITAMYVGQSAWGQANLETKWSGEFLVQLTY